jgi:hypothetical protein
MAYRLIFKGAMQELGILDKDEYKSKSKKELDKKLLKLEKARQKLK